MEQELLNPDFAIPHDCLQVLEFHSTDGRVTRLYTGDNYIIRRSVMTLDEIIERFNPSEKEIEAIKRNLNK